MPDQELIDAIATGDLITQVDATRSDYDLFKLSPPLAALVTARLAVARGANAAVLLAGGSAAAASVRVVESRQRIGGLLRNGHAHLRSIPEEDAPAADVLQALETYGFERGNLGDLESPSRLESLARSAQQVTPELPANLRYPANILTRLTTWLGVLDANKLIAGGGLLQTIIDDKDEKRDEMIKAISRVRHHYCAASDDGEKTAELARIGIATQTRSRRSAAPTAPRSAGRGELSSFDAAAHHPHDARTRDLSHGVAQARGRCRRASRGIDRTELGRQRLQPTDHRCDLRTVGHRSQFARRWTREQSCDFHRIKHGAPQ